MRTLVCLLLVGLVAPVQAQGPAKPGEPHKLLAKDVGTWDCEVKMFFRGPSGPPTTTKGVEVNRLVSGDLYMQTSFRYTMGNRGEFEGNSLIGYHPRTKTYVGTWVDNFTAAPSQISGAYDDRTKALTVHRTVVDAQGNEFKTKQITTWLDESRKKLEVFMTVPADGKEMDVKLMESLATRRK